MTTIITDQLIGLTSTTYTVRTDGGRTLGTYFQDHGAAPVGLPAGAVLCM